MYTDHYLFSFFFSFFFKFWSRDFFRKTKIRFMAAILKRNLFWSFFLLIYGCFGCIYIWCKFRTEIPTEKYLKWMGPSGFPPPCAQKGVKSSISKASRVVSQSYGTTFSFSQSLLMIFGWMSNIISWILKSSEASGILQRLCTSVKDVAQATDLPCYTSLSLATTQCQPFMVKVALKVDPIQYVTQEKDYKYL